MDLELYVIIVGVAALIYAFIARNLQFKFGNRTEMQALQKESKKLNEEMKEASKRNDQTKVNEIMKKQTELFPKMSKLMLGQFKIMFVVLIVFFAFTWGVGQFDPTVEDDNIIELNDEGHDCDEIAGDGIYTGCYKLETGSKGMWNVGVQLHSGGGIVGENYTYFLYEDGNPEFALRTIKGEPISVDIEKEIYSEGEEVKIFATPSKEGKVTAVLDQGTSFFVDLPFTIPLLNVKRITQVYWWFIFVALISGLIISTILNRMKKGDSK